MDKVALETLRSCPLANIRQDANQLIDLYGIEYTLYASRAEVYVG